MADPVIEYHRTAGTTERGAHLYVFDNGLVAARFAPSTVGPVVGDEDEAVDIDYVGSGTVDDWIATCQNLAAVNNPGYVGPGRGRLRSLRLHDAAGTQSYTAWEEPPEAVTDFVDDIVDALERTGVKGGEVAYTSEQGSVV